MKKFKSLILYSNTASGRTTEEIKKRICVAIDHLSEKHLGVEFSIGINFAEGNEPIASEIAAIIKPKKKAAKKTAKKVTVSKAVKKTAKAAKRSVVTVTLDKNDPSPKKTLSVVKEKVAALSPGKPVPKVVLKKAVVKKKASA